MKNKELYDKSISILVKAFFEGTLVFGNCQACAVGNLVAGNKGYRYVKDNNSYFRWAHCNYSTDEIHWYHVLGTQSGKQFLEVENYYGESKDQIDSTGYSMDDLLIIEGAFEGSRVGFNQVCETSMYRGLMAVVEALGEIHEVSKETTEETKLMFVKP